MGDAEVLLEPWRQNTNRVKSVWLRRIMTIIHQRHVTFKTIEVWFNQKPSKRNFSSFSHYDHGSWLDARVGHISLIVRVRSRRFSRK
jgi:hypothetical protein